MATVTSFEELEHPTKSELRQFAELFAPLFNASSEEARRQAVAALSQSTNVPSAVAFFIASQPIAIAAPFLTTSPCLDDETLINIARCQGAAHARTIVRRENLSPMVVDALVGLRHAHRASRVSGDNSDHLGTNRDLAGTVPPQALDPESINREDREEALRLQIKQLAAHMHRPAGDRLGLRTISDVQEALLVRFARAREADAFATTLADTLSASRWLAERIMLDISGHQLATTLKGIGSSMEDALFILERLYTHLREPIGEMTRSEILWNALDPDECANRVETWRRADQYTHAPQEVPVAAEQPAAPVVRTTASQRTRLRAVRLSR